MNHSQSPTKPNSRVLQINKPGSYTIEYSQNLGNTNSLPVSNHVTISVGNQDQALYEQGGQGYGAMGSRFRAMPVQTVLVPAFLGLVQRGYEGFSGGSQRFQGSEWERKYHEILRQMNELLLSNEKINRELFKVREEIKIGARGIQSSDMKEKYEMMRLKLEESEKQSNLFKGQNIRLQNLIQKMQNEQHSKNVNVELMSGLKASQKQNEEIIRELESMMKNMAILEEESKQTTERLHDQTKVNQNLRLEILEYGRKMKQLERNSKNGNLEAQIADLRRKIKVQESIIANYQQQQERRSSHETNELEAERKRVQALQQQILSFKELKRNYEESQRRYFLLEQQFIQSKISLQGLELLNSQLLEVNEKLKHSDYLLQTERRNTTSLRKEISELRIQLEERSNQLASGDQALRKRIIQLQGEASQLRHQVSDQQNRYSLLQRQNSQLRLKLEQKSGLSVNQLETERRKMLELQQQLSQYREFKGRYEEEFTRYSTLEKQYSQIREKWENENANNFKLKAQLGQMAEKVKAAELAHSAVKTSTDKNVVSLDPYLAQLLRSMVIETEVLVGELSLETSNRNKQVKSTLSSNFNQILKLLAQLTSSSSSSTVSSSDKANSRLIEEYSLKIRELEQRIRQSVETNRYKLQFLRSLFIQLECLAGEIQLVDDKCRQVKKFMNLEIKQGLEELGSFDLF